MTPGDDRDGAPERRGGVIAAAAALALLALWWLWPARGSLPPEIEDGSVLLSIAFAGEKPVVLNDGIRIDDVRGEWVHLHLGKGDERGRWVNFEHVRAYEFAPGPEE